MKTGQTLAHHRLVEKIGEGGMGVVWKAVDTRLDREVAVKVLPEDFAKDPERLARFNREAKLLASLNHTNIAAIHGIEEHEDVRFLVLELAPGVTLAERLAGGPLPVDEALEVCRQIAEAVEAAHEHGVIHRDLKPENVKITPEDRVKVLDFGLAKALEAEPEPASRETDPAFSPTMTSTGTKVGMLMGTAAYMSPEQARARPADRRSDVWAFGCLLYECLTGKQAFGGETITDILAAIVHEDPDWSLLPAETPPEVRRLLRRCLQRDAHHRLHDIADARIVIEEAIAGAPDAEEAPIAAPRPAPWRRALPWAVAAVAAVVAGAAVFWGATRSAAPAARSVGRLDLNLPVGQALVGDWSHPAALSPDGSLLVYVAGRAEDTRLYLRRWDSLDAEPVAGTEGAANPFFSPDGENVGFFAAGKLRKISLAGGAPVDLGDADVLGASWSRDGSIVFSPSWGSGLFRVPASGGKPEEVVAFDSDAGHSGYLWPNVLPDGSAVVFTAWTGGDFDESQIVVASLRTGERRLLIEGGTDARYAPSGHLVYTRAGALLGVPFDPGSLEIRGDPAILLDGVWTSGTTGAAHYTFSSDGTLLYVPGGVQLGRRQLLWVDREGATEPVIEDARPFLHPRLSPDGEQLAVTVEGATYHVWIYDVASGGGHRLTFEGESGGPVWTPDGERVTFWSNRDGTYDLFRKASDGSGVAERLMRSGRFPIPSSWSPDGKYLAYSESYPNPETGEDIWALSEDDEPLRLGTKFDEWKGMFSPNGRWLAYNSTESGRAEVYVQAFPGPGGKWQVTTQGGGDPVWARSGRELFFTDGEALWAIPVSDERGFSFGKARKLFEGGFLWGEGYDVSADGRRFVLLREEERAVADRFLVVLNWFELLERRTPSRR